MLFKYCFLNIISIIFVIKIIVNVRNIGIDSMLYFIDFIKFRLIIDINALVIPQDGHGMWNIFLNIQGICNLE